MRWSLKFSNWRYSVILGFYMQRGQANSIRARATILFCHLTLQHISTVLQHPAPPHDSLLTTAAAKINGVPEGTPQQKSMPGTHLSVLHEAFNIFQDRAYTACPREPVSPPGLSIRASWVQAFCFDTAVWKANCRHILRGRIQSYNW